jgi:AcrR family transcriptional regulator
MEKQKTIKRRNPVTTKAKILAAAQKAFAERGYAQTGLRDIATLADVSSALPVTYFGTKAGLFEAALENALNMTFTAEATGNRRATFGKDFVNAVCDRNLPMNVPAMIALSIGSDEAKGISSQFARDHIIKPIAKWLGPPRAKERAYLIVMITTGFVIFDRHITVEESGSGSSTISAWLENTIQSIVDGNEETINAFARNKTAGGKSRRKMSG